MKKVRHVTIDIGKVLAVCVSRDGITRKAAKFHHVLQPDVRLRQTVVNEWIVMVRGLETKTKVKFSGATYYLIFSEEKDV